MPSAHRTARFDRTFSRRLIVAALQRFPLALAFLLLPSILSAQQIDATLRAGTAPVAHAVAVNPATNLVYLTYDSNNNLRVINGQTNTLVADIGLGGNHNNQVAINPITNTIYVSNSDNYVTVLDGVTNNVIATIFVGNNPDMIAVNPATNRVYVANSSDATLSVIDGAANCVVATLPVVSQPSVLAIDPVANRIYLGSRAGGTIDVIDGVSNSVTATVQLDAAPFAIAVNSETDFVYVTSSGGNSVSYFSGANPTAAASKVNGTFSGPQQILVNPATNIVYVGNSGNQSVSYFTGASGDVAPGSPVALSLNANNAPQSIVLALDSQTNTVYAGICALTNNGEGDAAVSGSLSMFDALTNQLKISFGSVVSQDAAVDPATFSGQFSDGSHPGIHSIYAYAAYDSASVAPPAESTTSNLPASGNPGAFAIAVLSGSSNGGVLDAAAVDTATSLAASPNPSTFGQSVTLTATVSSTGGTPTGTVNFFDGVTLLGPGILSGGMTTLSTSTLAAGMHNLTAAYVATASFNASTSTAVVQNVGQASTTTTLTSTPNPSNFGQSVALNATVTSAGGIPTGTLNFFNGATLIIAATLANGKASINVASLPVGTTNFSAVYVGTANFAGSTSAIDMQVVNPAPTTTSLASTPNPSAFGQSVTLTATVAVPGFTPTGTVNFFNGVTLLGSGTITSGKAVFSTSSLPGGTNSLTATYLGTTNLATSTSAVLLQVVNPAPTTTALAASPNPSTFGQSVALTATVSSSAGTPAGSVNFFDGATLLGSAPLSGSTASFSTSSLAGGSHSLTAIYVATANFAASTSAAVMQTVNQVSTTTSLASSPNPSTFNESVTLSATVTSTAGVPTGTVNFFDGGTLLGTGTLSSGLAAISTPALTVGTHSLTAVYIATANFASSTSPIDTQTVNPAPTATSLSSAPNPSTFNESVTLSAIVTSSGGTPTGSVNFFDGAALLGSGTLSGSSAAFSTSALAVGSHNLTATYVATTNFASSTSSIVPQTVNPAPTAASLASAPNPSTFGGTVVLTASVTSAGGTPAGTVNFFDGATLLGSGVLSAGSANFSTSALATGTHSLIATYVASSNFASSTSTAITQAVNPAATATLLSASPNPSTFGGTVLLSATVTSTGGSPNGTVNFFDGATLLGSGTLAGGSATFGTSALAAGPHSLSAAYVASVNFAASTSPLVVQTVNPAATTTSLAASPNPSVLNQNVILAATVSSPAGAPQGVVNFFDGPSLLGSAPISGSTASIGVSNLAGGTHNLTASYSGANNFAPSTSNIVTQAVSSPNTLTMTVTSSSNPSFFGQPVKFLATLTSAASPAPGGMVTYMAGGRSIGTCHLHHETGLISKCSIRDSSLGVGSTVITAIYGGDSSYSSQSTTITQTVDADPTTTFLRSEPNPSTEDREVFLVASVYAKGEGFWDSDDDRYDEHGHDRDRGHIRTPRGKVTFFVGGKSIGAYELDFGEAHLKYVFANPGTYSVTAVYSGSETMQPSTSKTVILIVKPRAKDGPHDRD